MFPAPLADSAYPIQCNHIGTGVTAKWDRAWVGAPNDFACVSW
jgi:hypothetical protein